MRINCLTSVVAAALALLPAVAPAGEPNAVVTGPKSVPARQVVFLDAAEHRWIEELGGMNFMAVIDGTLVNGSWKVVGWIAGLVRRFQSGYIYHYALVMIIGVFVLMTYFVWLNK